MKESPKAIDDGYSDNVGIGTLIGNGSCKNSNDLDLYARLWKGEAIRKYDTKKSYSVSIVISYCNEGLERYNDYINNTKHKEQNIVIHNIYIICRCPLSCDSDAIKNSIPFKNVNVITSESFTYPDINFVSWLYSQMDPSYLSLPSSSISSLSNHFILFLNSNAINKQSNPRDLLDVFHSTIENGFGCVLPPRLENSLYHDRKIVTLFKPKQTWKSSPFSTFEIWLKQLDMAPLLIEKEELIPVCYGSSFAINSFDILSKSKKAHDYYLPIIKSVESHLMLHGEKYKEVREYVERLWASIFSHPLQTDHVTILRKYATDVYTKECCTYPIYKKECCIYTGSLLYDYRKTKLFRYFKGDTNTNTITTIHNPQRDQIDFSKLRVTLVLSHCKENLSWMKKEFKDVSTQTTFIFTKCNNPPSSPFHHNNMTKVISLPNLGRCDHTYARFMNQLEEKDATTDHIIIFSVASRDPVPMHYRSIKDVIRIAYYNGFACGMEHIDNVFTYHDTNILRQFALDNWWGMDIKSKYKNYGEYLDDLGIELSTPYAPVCYSGIFAAKASVIYSKKHIWDKLEQSLMRDDNIEEGHFAERIWAGILTNPMNSKEFHKLQNLPNTPPIYFNYAGYLAFAPPDYDVKIQDKYWLTCDAFK